MQLIKYVYNVLDEEIQKDFKVFLVMACAMPISGLLIGIIINPIGLLLIPGTVLVVPMWYFMKLLREKYRFLISFFKS